MPFRTCLLVFAVGKESLYYLVHNYTSVILVTDSPSLSLPLSYTHTHTAHATKNTIHLVTHSSIPFRVVLFPAPLSHSLTHFHFLWIIHNIFYYYHNDNDLDSLVETATALSSSSSTTTTYKHNRRLLFVRPTLLEITNKPVRTSQNIIKVLVQSQPPDKI